MPAAADRSGLVVATVSVTGSPYGTAVTRDGSVVFVTVTAVKAGDRTGVAVFRHTATSLTPIGFVTLRSRRALGLALVPDEKTLLVAGDDGLALVDVRAARARRASVRYVRAHAESGTNDVVVSSDGRFAYATELLRGVVGVYALQQRPDGSVDAVPREEIAVERAPVGLALSRGGDTLYVVSRLSHVRATPLNACPRGWLAAIDTEHGAGAPRRGRAGTALGCEPEQLALSADGSSLWVAARGDKSVVGFDAARLRTDPLGALKKRIEMAWAPAAVALVAHDTALVAADVRRFDPSAAGPAATFFDVRGEPAVINGFATGSDPVRFAASPDGSTLYLTNRGSRTVQMIDAFHAVQPGE